MVFLYSWTVILSRGLGKIVSIKVNTLSKTNLVGWLPVDMLRLKNAFAKDISVQGLTYFHTGSLPFSTVACARNGSLVSGSFILCHWDITLNLSLLIRLTDWPFWDWFRERLGQGCVELHCGSVLGDEFLPTLLCELAKVKGKHHCLQTMSETKEPSAFVTRTNALLVGTFKISIVDVSVNMATERLKKR